MNRKKLGNSNMELTPIGFGSWAIGGGDWQFAWGPQDDNDSIAAIHKALDLGINWIDTAAVYGLGHSEEMVRARSRPPLTSHIFSPNAALYGMKREVINSLKQIRREAEEAFGASRWMPSISTKCTGLSRTRRSKTHGCDGRPAKGGQGPLDWCL